MTNKNFFVGMLILVLTFTMALVGCATTPSGETEPALLIGTWIGRNEELKFDNNGSFEATANGPAFKGTYDAASDGRITVTITQLHGGQPAYNGVLESKWYTNTELKAALEARRGASLTNAQQKEIDGYFAPATGTYSTSGNILTIKLPGMWGNRRATYVNSQPPSQSVSSQSVSTRYMVVNADSLNVRSGPSADSSAVGALPRNTRVEVIDSSAQWWKIRSGSVEGYVNSSYLKEN